MQTKHTSKKFPMSSTLAFLKTIPKGFTSILKAITFITCFYFFLCNQEVNAQTYPKFHQPYRLIEENHQDMVEISIMVAQCDSTGADSVYVMIFNEKPVKDTIEFDLTIYKQNNSDSTTKSFTYMAGIGEMAIPSCGNGNLRNLVYALPTGYDPEKVTFSVKFK